MRCSVFYEYILISGISVVAGCHVLCFSIFVKQNWVVKVLFPYLLSICSFNECLLNTLHIFFILFGTGNVKSMMILGTSTYTQFLLPSVDTSVFVWSCIMPTDIFHLQCKTSFNLSWWGPIKSICRKYHYYVSKAKAIDFTARNLFEQ